MPDSRASRVVDAILASPHGNLAEEVFERLASEVEWCPPWVDLNRTDSTRYAPDGSEVATVHRDRDGDWIWKVGEDRGVGRNREDAKRLADDCLAAWTPEWVLLGRVVVGG